MDPIQQIQASLNAVSDQLKEAATRALAERERNNELSAETTRKIDALLLEQGTLMARLSAAEQLVATLETRGPANVRPLTMGEQVLESEAVKGWLQNPSGRIRVPVKAAITGGSSSAGDLLVPQYTPGIVPPGLQRLTIRDLLMWGRTTQSSVQFVRELVYTNNADVVSENPASGKPESNITFEEAVAQVATIAHYLRASKQILADVPQLQTYIDTRLRYGLRLVEEDQLLNGSGVGLNIDGLVTQASAYVNPGVTVDNETRIDRLRLALLQVELAEYQADGIVLSPIDWTAIELLKTDFGYLFSNPRQVTTPTLWGRNVVATQSMGAADFLVGAFGMAAGGWDREDVSVIISLEDADNITKNMVTLLCEERVALTVYRPTAFVTGDFDDLDAS